MASGLNIGNVCDRLNAYLIDLIEFFHARNMKISTTKSTATLFTTWTAQMKLPLNVQVDGAIIPTTNYPNVLGVTFDSMYKSSQHTTAICDKLRNRNKVHKSLAGSTWGADKETLLTTCNAIGKFVVSYAASAWFANVSDTQWDKLQIWQNAALRTATGCHLMSAVDHLHEETKILPVRRHNRMLTMQYLLGCYRQDDPNHHLVDMPEPPRVPPHDTSGPPSRGDEGITDASTQQDVVGAIPAWVLSQWASLSRLKGKTSPTRSRQEWSS
ncbi:uncharacterized protein [Musca autumnalis]|uniref:uncharacterized protein n=1 Tax=Musca autumnalis TaxID=221902 RepID=UPI003CF81CAC